MRGGVVLAAALWVASSGCARDNPEFGLAGEGTGSGGASETGRPATGASLDATGDTGRPDDGMPDGGETSVTGPSDDDDDDDDDAVDPTTGSSTDGTSGVGPVCQANDRETFVFTLVADTFVSNLEVCTGPCVDVTYAGVPQGVITHGPQSSVMVLALEPVALPPLEKGFTALLRVPLAETPVEDTTTFEVRAFESASPWDDTGAPNQPTITAGFPTWNAAEHDFAAWQDAGGSAVADFSVFIDGPGDVVDVATGELEDQVWAALDLAEDGVVGAIEQSLAAGTRLGLTLTKTGSSTRGIVALEAGGKQRVTLEVTGCPVL